jgi:hypothetical protein
MSDAGISSHERGASAQRGLRGIAVYFVPALVLIAMTLPRMNQSLWYDEFWRTKLYLNEQTLHARLFRDVHNPLYNACMYLWINVFGDGEVSIRIPSLALGVAIVVLAAWWTRRLIGEIGAWVTGLFLAVSPVMIWHSSDAKNVMLAMLASVGCLVCVERTATRRAEVASAVPPWKRPHIWLCIALVVGGFTSWNSLFAAVCAMLAAATVWKRIDRRNWRALGWAWLVALLALLPLLIYKSMQIPELMRRHTRYFDWREVVLFVTNWLPSGNTLWPVQPYEDKAKAFTPPHLWFTIGMGVVVLAVMLIGVRALSKRGIAVWVARPMWIGLILIFAGSAAVRAWYGDGKWNIYQERNLLWMIVPLAIMCAAAVLQCAVWLHRRSTTPDPSSAKRSRLASSDETLPDAWCLMAGASSRLVWLFAAALIALPLTGSIRMATTQRNAWTVYKPNPDWRAAAAMIAADGGPGARVMEDGYQLDPLWYYGPGLQRVVVPRDSWLGNEVFVRMSGATDGMYVVDQRHRFPYNMGRFDRNGVQRKKIGEVDGLTVYKVWRAEAEVAK